MSNKEQGRMYVTFAAYLNQLKANELQKPPEQRKEVPTLTELAQAAGRHEINFSNMVNGKTKALNLEVAQLALDELWRRGFEPQITDIIRYSPPKN